MDALETLNAGLAKIAGSEDDDLSQLLRIAEIDPAKDLAFADLRNISAPGVDLASADLRGANLSGANLEGAILSHAKLAGADLQGANLSSADLRNADLTSTNLDGTILIGAQLDGTILDRRTKGHDLSLRVEEGQSFVVVIDRDLTLAREIDRTLRAGGRSVESYPTASEGLEAVQRIHPKLVLVERSLPGEDGLEVLRSLRNLDPTLPVILMAEKASISISDAIEAIRLGAVDYLQKPFEVDDLRVLVDRVLAAQSRDRELAYLRSRQHAKASSIIGADARILEILDHVDRLKQADLRPVDRPTILITGETGTGKGMLAQAIHTCLSDGPFIDVNCTAIPETLAESELFGHEQGAFSGAQKRRTGLFAAAEGGTLFLDEIGSLGLGMQSKLLKAIDEKRVRPVGSTQNLPSDVHIITATNQNLDEAVRERTFRTDLLHRLRVIEFRMPPLRERKGDLPLLVQAFLDTFCRRYGFRSLQLSNAMLERLQAHDWPGNVRELRNVIERVVLLSGGRRIDEALLTGFLPSTAEPVDPPRSFELPEEGISLARSLAELERDLLEQALERTLGNRTGAARLLRIDRSTLRHRLEKHGIRWDGFTSRG